jgi:putative transcriptional regulator
MKIPLDIPKQPFPEVGDLLISEPFMRDENLRRSVIYLCEVSEDGAYGMVLNHPLPVPMKMLIDDFPESEFYANYGGPVDDEKLFYIHNLDFMDNAEQIKDDLFFGGSFEEVKTKIVSGEIDSSNIRFFVGYTGWDKGQLQREIREKSWIVWKNHSRTILNSVDLELWSVCMKEMGGIYAEMEKYPLFYEHN